MAATTSGRSKGAVIFAGVPDRQHEVAQKLGVRDRSLVSKWRSGERTPKLANRKQLLAKYKIPIEAWDEPPDAPSRWGEASAIGQLEMLEAVERRVRMKVATDETMTELERTKLARELAKLTEDIRRLKGEDVVEIDVIRHPQFVAYIARLKAALKRHPAALADVVSAIESASAPASDGEV